MSTKNKLVTAKEDGKKYWISRPIVLRAMVLVVDEPNGAKTLEWKTKDKHGYVVGGNPNYKKDLYILINQRGNGAPSEQGKWNITVGYLDRDETLKEGCTREVMEEQQVYIDPEKWKYDSYNDDFTPGDEHTQPVTIRFYCILTMEEYNAAKVKGLSLKDKFKGEYNEVMGQELMKVTMENINNKNWAFNHRDIVIDELEKFEEAQNSI